MYFAVMSQKGGKGSGFHGHEGRPGIRGGSATQSSDISRMMVDTPIIKDPNWRYSKGISVSAVIDVIGDGKAIVKTNEGDSIECEREVAAYRISKIMGFEGLVPETVLDTIGENDDITLSRHTIDRKLYPGDEVSIQHWEEGCELGYNYKERPVEDSLVQMGILDVIIGNLDRHGGNYLVRKGDKRVVAIDHNLAFAHDDNYSLFWKRVTDMAGGYLRVDKKYVKTMTRFFDESRRGYSDRIRRYMEDNLSNGDEVYQHSQSRVMGLLHYIQSPYED